MIQTIHVNGYDLTCAERGAGQALVLIHGALCDYRYWLPQMAPFGEHYRTIAVSLRHYYPEAWKGPREEFSAREHVEDVAALIDALGATPVHLLGHSRGADIALCLATRYPGKLRTLTLAEPGIQLEEGPEGFERAAERKEFLLRAAELIEQGQAEEGLRIFADTVSGPGAWQRSAPHFKQMARDNARTLVGQLADTPLSVSHSDLQAVTAPVLLVGGESSPPPFPRILDVLERTLPRVQRVSVPRASHAMNAQRPSVFNAAVLDFLASPSGARKRP